jgi:hemerythrin-like metal-binding protein
MHLIVWNDAFSVGVKQFDEEHKQIIVMINNLQTGIDAEESVAVTGNVLGGMIEYAVNHFAHEEELMREYGYPDFKEHRDLHDDFFVKVNEFRAKFKGIGDSAAGELMNFLEEWLIKHILNIDKKYESFFKSKGLV